jgi:hypothetical protein
MKIDLITAIAAQLIVAFLLMRSGFYLWRVRKNMPKYTFWLIMSIVVMGATLALFNTTDPAYILRRFPFRQIFDALVAIGAFYYTKQTKNNLFTIENVMKQEYTKVEKYVMKKIKAKNSPIPVSVSENDLIQMQIGKPYKPCPLMVVTRINIPSVYDYSSRTYKFKCSMLKDAKFGRQFHPDLTEEIIIDKGIIIDDVTGYEYYPGDIWKIKAGQDHAPRCIERCELRCYLYKEKI